MWAHTTEGHERDAASHGATLTDADGFFRMDMPQIVPALGRPMGISPMTQMRIKPLAVAGTRRYSCAHSWHVRRIPRSLSISF